MASLAEKYVFERLAMLEKEHDEHLKASIKRAIDRLEREEDEEEEDSDE